MRVRTPRIALTAVAVGATALTFGLASTAQAGVARPADTGARSGDIVGVGSDTLQNAADFVLDATGNGTSGGYNSIGNPNRIFNYYATGDANGRATYDGTCGTGGTGGIPQICTTANAGNPNVLAATVILRGGSKPVVRPNGSGGGAAALIADAPGATTSYEGLTNGSINFARMSRLPNSTEIGNCATTTACAGLHVYQFATDNLQIAHVKSGYNGPVAGLSKAELVSIYTCKVTTWNTLPGNSSGSTDTIDPLIPQSGSGTRNFFLDDLASANGGTDPVPGTCVRVVQEHDPDGIYQDSRKGDAIEPFSTGKLTLINNGYFSNGNPSAGTATGAFSANQLVSDGAGTASDGNATYTSSRGLYIAVRQEDLGSGTPFQPGSSQNFITALFSSTGSYVNRTQQAPSIQAAGFTQAFKDCGINPATC